MSVVKAQMVVISYAVTILDCMNVSVMLATDLALMVSPVMVCKPVIYFEYVCMWMTRNFYVDVDECMEDSDRCVHNCQNTEGSYTCNCSEGFLLGNDGYSCIGT